MSRTTIEWVARPGTTPESWNPITGCSKVSEGCRSCWAERMARRLAGRCGYPEVPHHFDVTLHPDRLFLPLRWRKPRTVFTVSMGDLFHETIKTLDSTYVRDIFAVMALTRHTFMLLTKRPHVAERTLTDKFAGGVKRATWELKQMDGMYDKRWHASEFEWPLPNVWLGTTIELPEYSYRAHYLRQTPAAMRFISFEPLLSSFADYPGVLDEIDWVIAGGESGPGARPMQLHWISSIVKQCQNANVPVFVKQLGGWPNKRNHLEDMPENLRIREFPNVNR